MFSDIDPFLGLDCKCEPFSLHASKTLIEYSMFSKSDETDLDDFESGVFRCSMLGLHKLRTIDTCLYICLDVF